MLSLPPSPPLSLPPSLPPSFPPSLPSQDPQMHQRPSAQEDRKPLKDQWVRLTSQHINIAIYGRQYDILLHQTVQFIDYR